MFTGTRSLSRILSFDAATCAAMGAGLALGAGPLGGLLDLPPVLLRGAGLLLLPFSALLVWAARSARPQPALVRGIIAANLGWALASAAVLLGGLVAPNTLGIVVVAGQAAAVAVIADLEAIALRQSRMAAA
jgi:hypothetical protein